jgi:D-lactate dehydrogenase
MRIALFSTKSYDHHYFDKANASFGYELLYHEGSLKPSSVKLAEGCDAVCGFVNDRLNSETLSQLSEMGIKLIILRCAGFNNVDLEEADAKDITVMRVPAYSPHAVAEHAVALILGLNRKTHKAYNRIRENNFSLERLEGFDIHGKTAGVIGTGNIGRVFAGIMKGFGCRVLGYDVYPSPGAEKEGIVYVSLDELLAESDIISLHCPLTPETYQIINARSLSLIKKGSMLINTSRGKLINTGDVIKALKSKQLGYLGIDVYAEEEKLFFKDLSERIIEDDQIARLMTFPNVLITAHQGFLTHEALEQIAHTSLQNVKDYFSVKKTGNIVSLQNLGK